MKSTKEQIRGVALIVAISIIEELKEVNNWSDKEVVDYITRNNKWELMDNDSLMFGLMHSDSMEVAELFLGEIE